MKQRKQTSTMHIGGGEIADPYRWLEDDHAEDTKAWVKSQNEVSLVYLEQIPFRKRIRERLEEVWDYEKFPAPFNYGEYTCFYKNSGLQNQSVLYRKKGKNGKREIFLDPNGLSEEGTTSLAGTSFTHDGKIFAYAVSEAGSDWIYIYVINAESKVLLDDVILDANFTGISWKGNEGFYYSSYEMPDGNKFSAKTNNHKLYFHQLDSSQTDDQLICGDNNTSRHVYALMTEDNRYRMVSADVFMFIRSTIVIGPSFPRDELMISQHIQGAGHGAGKPTGKIIDEMADKFAYAWYNMQVDPFNQSQR